MKVIIIPILGAPLAASPHIKDLISALFCVFATHAEVAQSKKRHIACSS